jgi:hypothetical protein
MFMNRASRWSKIILLPQILSAFLAAMIFCASLGYVLPAQAVPRTPEATSYQVDHSTTEIRIAPAQAKEKVQKAGDGLIESIKETADTVREKLNLDEPLPQGTKTFLRQIKGEDVEVQEPKPFGAGKEPQNE